MDAIVNTNQTACMPGGWCVQLI